MCAWAWVTGQSGGFGDGGNGWGMSESQRRGKNEDKKAKKWFMPAEQRWREGFFYNWPFPSGPRLPGWEEETGGQRSVWSLSLQHTHTHSHTQRDRKDGPDCGGLQEHIMRVWDRGDVETSINHHRLITVATALLLAGHIIPKQNTHTITPKAPHTHKSLTKTSEKTHTHTHTHTVLYFSTCEHQSRLAPGPEALCG